MKHCTLAHIGTQEGIGRFPSVELFNVITLEDESPSPALAIGTTTTIKQVIALGFFYTLEPKLSTVHE